MEIPGSRYVTSCDTLVAFTGPPAGRRAIFAKNSDRPTLECQPLARVPAAIHEAGSRVECRYVTIPQAHRTLAVLGSRPWWIWGFEHGVNEAGVAIGNEAINTHDPVPETGLMGMDLVRLGLERGATAAEAKQVITGLLEEHGQGGISLRGDGRTYHNSFLVADAAEAWVIETSGRHWVARRTTSGAAIANLVTIEDDWDERSDGVEEHARAAGYWTAPASTRFNFRAAYENVAARARSEARYSVGCRLLATRNGERSVPGMMRYLRDHFENAPEHASDPRPVCLHPTVIPGSSTASMIAELDAGELPPVAWTSMATPCTGIFIPVTVGQRLPAALETGTDEPRRDSAWWALRQLQYAVDRDRVRLTPIVRATWDPLEKRLLDADPRIGPDDLRALTAEILTVCDELKLQVTAAHMKQDHPGGY